MTDDKPLTRNIRAGEDPLSIEEYEAAGGYQALRKALGKHTPNEITEMVDDAKLLGRGGAGVSTGFKWGAMPTGDDKPGPTYLLANADEMEPGTFKDRLLMEGDPHQLIEGIIVSAYAVQADEAFIFLRWAYETSELRLKKALQEARDAGYLGRNILGSGYDLNVQIHVSAGRYMCGEETGLLNAMEGRRARPRSKPPYPQQSGLWGRPSVVQNVETLCNVPHIVANGVQWYRGISNSEDEGGTKLYGASGRVKNPGLYELPLGSTLGEVLLEHAGGMQDGYKFRATLPGGASTGFLTDQHFDLKLDFASTQKAGSRLGTGCMVVLDDKRCPVAMLANLETFFARESCGWCTPCREGLPWTVKMLEAIEHGDGRQSDLEHLSQHCRFLNVGTYCALAPGAVMPLQTAMKHFRDDFERHIREKKCPYEKN